MVRPFTVRLVGGLGNQLFGYYACAGLAAQYQAPLRVDTSQTRYGITDHGVTILDYDLPGEWITENPNRKGHHIRGARMSRVARRAHLKWPALGRISHHFYSTTIGDDPLLMQQKPGTTLNGYFQSWRLVQSAVSAGLPRRPKLRLASSWLQDAIEAAQSECPVAVHVRRGDYAHFGEYELLGPRYYESAITYARHKGMGGPIWLFSDDLKLARQAIGRFAPEAKPIRSPDGPAVELLAMSYASANVIANSTYSWWGAWMGGPERAVVGPLSWFVNRRGPTGLVPPEWVLLPTS